MSANATACHSFDSAATVTLLKLHVMAKAILIEGGSFSDYTVPKCQGGVSSNLPQSAAIDASIYMAVKKAAQIEHMQKNTESSVFWRHNRRFCEQKHCQTAVPSASASRQLQTAYDLHAAVSPTRQHLHASEKRTRQHAQCQRAVGNHLHPKVLASRPDGLLLGASAEQGVLDLCCSQWHTALVQESMYALHLLGTIVADAHCLHQALFRHIRFRCIQYANAVLSKHVRFSMTVLRLVYMEIE